MEEMKNIVNRVNKNISDNSRMTSVRESNRISSMEMVSTFRNGWRSFGAYQLYTYNTRGNRPVISYVNNYYRT